MRPTAAFKELTVEKRERKKKKICPTSHEIIMDLTQRPRRRSTHHSGGSVTSGASAQHMKGFVRLVSGARKERAGMDLNLQVPPESPQRWESSQRPARGVSKVATSLRVDGTPPWSGGQNFFFFFFTQLLLIDTCKRRIIIIPAFCWCFFFLYSFIECFS